MQEIQQTQSPVLVLQMNLDQVNVILSQLGKIPYETIAPLVNSIRAQAGQQLEQLAAQAAAAQAEAGEAVDTGSEPAAE